MNDQGKTMIEEHMDGLHRWVKLCKEEIILEPIDSIYKHHMNGVISQSNRELVFLEGLLKEGFDEKNKRCNGRKIRDRERR